MLVLFAIFAYFWIGINPLAAPSNLADQAGNAAAAQGGNLINQLLVICLSLGAMVSIARHPARSAFLSPRGLLLMLLAWFAFASLFAESPESAFRRIIFSVLLCGCANAVLLLPRSSKDFATLLAVVITSALALSYFAVVFMPGIGIHQGNELEASLAGSWRGHFGHKNAAAAAMAFAVFIGLYLRSAAYPRLGPCIAVLATVFLYFSGGKTSTAMLPAVLLIAWMFERSTLARYPFIIGSLLLLNWILIGSSLSPSMAGWIKSLGVDETFTGRNAIWSFAVGQVSESPIVGYGFQTFWRSEYIRSFMGDTLNFLAAHSHNSFLETLINAGFPALVLIVTWLVLLPIRDAGRALTSRNDLALTRLFLRIWLFTIYLACLENLFFENNGPVWFTALVAVFGLRLQARATHVPDRPLENPPRR